MIFGKKHIASFVAIHMAVVAANAQQASVKAVHIAPVPAAAATSSSSSALSMFAQTLNNKSFDVTSDFTVTVVKTADSDFQKLQGGPLVIKEGTDLTVLDIVKDENFGEIAHLGLNSDEEGAISDLWVRVNDLNNNCLEVQDDEDFRSDANATDKTDAGDIRGQLHRSKVKAKKRRMTYCYRFVKKYLMETGKVPVYLSGGSAYMAPAQLMKYGFKKIAETPSHVRTEDVCVYRGGNGGNGHIEVFTKKGWYYGYGYLSHPISRANHPFVGCYRK